jgi:hypothetical protein
LAKGEAMFKVDFIENMRKPDQGDFVAACFGNQMIDLTNRF